MPLKFIPTNVKYNDSGEFKNISIPADRAYMNKAITVSSTQPTNSDNKLWINTNEQTKQTYQIPTMTDLAGYRTAAEQDAIDAAQDAEIDEIQATEVIVVNISSYSGSQVRVPTSGTNSAITANHVLLASTIGTPANQTGDWTVTTYDGYLTLSGTASGTTTVQLVLGKAGTTI